MPALNEGHPPVVSKLLPLIRFFIYLFLFIVFAGMPALNEGNPPVVSKLLPLLRRHLV
jgi:hypothetical protein